MLVEDEKFVEVEKADMRADIRQINKPDHSELCIASTSLVCWVTSPLL